MDGVAVETGGGIAATVPTQGAPPAPAPAMPAFMDIVPADLREEQFVKDFAKAENPFDALFKGYKGAQELIGRKSNAVEIPGENATPEQVQAYRKAVGVPETPDGYKFSERDLSKEPEAVQKVWKASGNDALYKVVAQAAHEAGIPPAQLAKLVETVEGHNLNQIKTMVAAAQQSAEQQNVKIKEDFAKFYGGQDKADAARRIGEETLKKVGMPKEIAQMGADAALIWLANTLHQKVYSNDKLSTNGGGAPQMTKQELHNKIMQERAKTDPRTGKPIYSDKAHPQHKQHFAYVQSLYKDLHEMGTSSE
ncbi:MAG TPA: hypothetical protein V6D22_13640 [Candidatus Obscuribacterales bacterium]